MAHPSAYAHPLRKLIIASFIPSFALCIASGAVTNDALPAVALPILFVSTVMSSIFLLHGHHENRRPSINLGRTAAGVADRVAAPVALIIYDAAFAVGLLVLLIFTWINMPYRVHKAVLVAYTTVPIMLVAAIHAYLGLVTLSDLLDLRQFFQTLLEPHYCKHCHEPTGLLPHGLTSQFQTSGGHLGYRRVNTVGDPYADSDPGDIADDRARVGLEAVDVKTSG